MTKEKLSKIELLEGAKARVHKVFRPSDIDPVVRYIGENGKMGLRHLYNEEVVQVPTEDFIDMPEAEIVTDVLWEGRKIKDLYVDEKNVMWNKISDNYKNEYDQSEVQYYPPFNHYFKFSEKKTGNQCLFDDKGEIVIPAIYSNLYYETWFDKRTCKQMYLTNVLRMSKYDENDDVVYGYVRLDGKEVLPAKYSSDAAFKEMMKQSPEISEIPAWGYRWLTELFYYYDEKTDKYGFKTLKGKKLTEPISVYQPRMLGFVNDRRIFEIRSKGSYGDDDISGLVDETGKEILPCKYEKGLLYVYDIQKLIIARRKKKHGVFNLDGKPVVKCAYSGGCSLEEPGIIAAYTSKDVTLFNRLGQIIIDKGQYDKIAFSKDGILEARDLNCLWWYIDLWGNKKQK